MQKFFAVTLFSFMHDEKSLEVSEQWMMGQYKDYFIFPDINWRGVKETIGFGNIVGKILLKISWGCI